MHRVLLYLIGNVLFLVLYTGMATGIRVATLLTSRQDAHGLRLHRSNLISAHTCVGKPPAFFVTFFTVLPLSRGGTNTGLLIVCFFSPRLEQAGVQASKFFLKGMSRDLSC